MFESCIALKSVYVKNFDTANAQRKNIFKNCYSIVGGEGTKYSVDKDEYARIDGGSSKPGYLRQVGWIKKGTKWSYKNYDGSLKTGWQQINKRWYYFNANGVMQTGWQQINKKWYHFNASGEMQTGWQQINKKWYCFDASGVMQTSKWISGTYYVKADGTMAVSEWVDGGKYYVGADGKWVKSAKK